MHSTQLEDESKLRDALSLAAQSSALASPEPANACILVTEGTSHGAALQRGADPVIAALSGFPGDPRGGTAYMVQEPSILEEAGRYTAVKSLLDAGISRVVACTSSLYKGQEGLAFEILKQAGVEINVGLLSAEAYMLNRAYLKWSRTQAPYVTLCAPSLPKALRAALRHAHDAVMLDIQSVEEEPDELFQDTTEQERARRLLRFILDPKLTIDPSTEVIASWDHDLILLTRNADKDRVDAVRGVGIAVEELAPDSREGWFDTLRTIASMQVLSLLVEGSEALGTELLNAKLVDELILEGASHYKHFSTTDLPARKLGNVEGTKIPVVAYLLSHDPHIVTSV